MMQEFESISEISEEALKDAADAFNYFYFIKSDSVSTYGFGKLEPIMRTGLGSIIKNGILYTTINRSSNLEFKGYTKFGNDYLEVISIIELLRDNKGYLFECCVNGIESEENNTFIGQIALVDKEQITEFKQMYSVIADLHCLRNKDIDSLTSTANKFRYKTQPDGLQREVAMQRSIKINNRIYMIFVNLDEPNLFMI